MELEEKSVVAKTRYEGTQSTTAQGGKSLMVRITPLNPDGEELLDFELPAGGDWTLQVNVLVTRNV